MRPVLLGSALAGLAALYLAMMLLGGGEADRALLVALYAGDRPGLAFAARWLTELGGFAVLTPVGLAALALAWRKGRGWRPLVWFAAAALCCRLLVELQKHWVSRLRPDANEHLVAAQSFAFPSGHAANAMMIWLGAALLLAHGRRRPLAAAATLAVLVGLTRPVLGVHWPSDVIAGWAFGLFWVLLWFSLSGRRGRDCSPASA